MERSLSWSETKQAVEDDPDRSAGGDGDFATWALGAVARATEGEEDLSAEGEADNLKLSDSSENRDWISESVDARARFTGVRRSAP